MKTEEGWGVETVTGTPERTDQDRYDTRKEKKTFRTRVFVCFKSISIKKIAEKQGKPLSSVTY